MPRVCGCCAPAPQFPTSEQNAAAVRASENDKTERIDPGVLGGMWIGDKGSVLSFNADHQMSYRVGVEGESKKGIYKLEGYKLFLGSDSLGNVLMMKKDQFLLAQTRDKKEQFRKFAE